MGSLGSQTNVVIDTIKFTAFFDYLPHRTPFLIFITILTLLFYRRECNRLLLTPSTCADNDFFPNFASGLIPRRIFQAIAGTDRGVNGFQVLNRPSIVTQTTPHNIAVTPDVSTFPRPSCVWRGGAVRVRGYRNGAPAGIRNRHQGGTGR